MLKWSVGRVLLAEEDGCWDEMWIKKALSGKRLVTSTGVNEALPRDEWNQIVVY